MTNLYQFFANINLHEFCFVLSILYSSCTVDIIGGWVICCVIGGDHSSGQAICTLAASDSSSIDPVLQNETSCLGACQEEPNCYAYAHNTVDCKFRKTSVPNCLTFLVSENKILNSIFTLTSLTLAEIYILIFLSVHALQRKKETRSILSRSGSGIMRK